MASKQAEEEATKNGYKDLKLEKVLIFPQTEKTNLEGIRTEFIYSYINYDNKIKYLSLYNRLEFKNNNELNLSDFTFSTTWNDKFLVDYSKSLDDILNDVFKPGSYEVIWSADKQ